MTIKVIVELQAKPGKRVELKNLIETLILRKIRGYSTTIRRAP